MRKLFDWIIKKLGGCTQQEYQAGIDRIWQYHFERQKQWHRAVKPFKIIVDDMDNEDGLYCRIGKLAINLGILEFADVEFNEGKAKITICVFDKKRL